MTPKTEGFLNPKFIETFRKMLGGAPIKIADSILLPKEKTSDNIRMTKNRPRKTPDIQR
jgi:hypothetical protein